MSRKIKRRRLALALTTALAGLVTLAGTMACGVRYAVPAVRTADARFGRLGGVDEAPPAGDALCTHWSRETFLRDRFSATHVSFPETDRERSCFTPVVYDRSGAHPGTAPPACSYPSEDQRATLLRLAERMEQLATKPSVGADALFPCSLSNDARRAAAAHDAVVLRRFAARSQAERWPYAAVVIPGHGLAEQDETALAGYLPGEACRPLRPGDLGRLGVMPLRTARAREAMVGGVAPLAIATGGAVHSHVVEAFSMQALLACDARQPMTDVLVEPCAQHTHTNLRNAGRWLHAMGARAAYLVTDDHIQSDYFQDWNGFELLAGSIDQRSLRDFGFVIGSWRQASVGMDSGFWFTPYRFWAEPRDGLGSITCVFAGPD